MEMKLDDIFEIIFRALNLEALDYAQEFNINSADDLKWRGQGFLQEVGQVSTELFEFEYHGTDRDLNGEAWRVFSFTNKETNEVTLFGWQGWYSSYGGYEWDDTPHFVEEKQRIETYYVIK